MFCCVSVHGGCRRIGLVVASGSSDLGSSPDWRHNFVSLDKTLLTLLITGYRGVFYFC